MPGQHPAQDAFCDWVLQVVRRTTAPSVWQDKDDADRPKDAPEGAQAKG